MTDYSYAILRANEAIKAAHEESLKREYMEAAQSVAEAIVWLRQAKESFVELNDGQKTIQND